MPDIHEAVEQHADRLLEKANVVAVGEGDGEVVVFVSEKKPLEDLDPMDVVDPVLEDEVPTDVVESGEFWALGEESLSHHTNGLRPGASIGQQGRGGTGTLGCLVMKGGKLHLLSNNHVIAGNNTTPIGHSIIHPGPADNRTGGRVVVGKLVEFEEINFTSNNTMDAAVAEITNPSLVVGNDAITSPVADVPSVGTTTVKTGRTTATTTGKVVAINVTSTVNYDGKTARYVGQVMTEKMLDPGDSGSIGRLSDGRPWGLGFAGSSSRSIFSPLKPVFGRFGLALPEGAEEPPPEEPPEPPETPPEEVPPEQRPELRYGDRGAFVGLLQQRLRAIGYHIDQYTPAPFGPQTEAAVRDFQRKQGLPVTGIVDTATWVKLEDPQPPVEPPDDIKEFLIDLRNQIDERLESME